MESGIWDGKEPKGSSIHPGPDGKVEMPFAVRSVAGVAEELDVSFHVVF